MININELTKDDINRPIIYTDNKSSEEYGYLVSWNDKYIFIDYGFVRTEGGVATSPENLAFND